MTLTAIVGALVALVARPTEPQRTRDQDEIERLKRAQRKLLDRIETLELDNQGLIRELAAERNLLTHWIGEAARFARDAREERERQMRQYQPQQPVLPQDHQFALYSQQAQALAQQQQAQAQQNAALLQQQQNGMQWAQHAGAHNFDGFCNCVPSRTQMFDAMIGQVDNMVEQLNQLHLPRR